ncbi:MAG: sensor domain-containing protein [Actinomycetota bacterium]|nr:sensor domain-containing protein [Actinomycetota bacterium]
MWRRTLDFVAAALEEDVNQEGKVVEALLGVRMPRRPRVVAIDGGILARIKWWLTDRRTWTTLVYMFFQLPLGIFYFAMLVMTLTLSIGAIVGTPVSAVTGVPMIQTDNYNFVPSPWAVPFIIAVGALAIVALMHLVCAIGRLHGAYAKAMLVGSPEERQSLHAGT